MIAKGKKMKLYRKVVPYILLGSAAIFNHNSANAQNQTSAPDFNISQDLVAKASYKINEINNYAITQSRLIARAQNTRDMYIDNMLGAQKRLAPYLGKKGYKKAVSQELPGAPVGLHCVYGQYTQLMRALNESGDTLNVIPRGANSACLQFKSIMGKKYSKPEYGGAIHEGHVYETDSAYNAALAKYLATRGLSLDKPSPKLEEAKKAFAKSNFSAEHINPGSIWIVPRFRGAKNKFHAIMFLGRGRVENGNFIPDEKGRYMFAAHNSERLGDLFNSWDTSNVFSADIEKILTVEYGKELKRLESMSREKMIEYIIAGTPVKAADLMPLPRSELIRMVQAKYFGDDIKRAIAPQQQVAQIAMQQMHQDRV